MAIIKFGLDKQRKPEYNTDVSFEDCVLKRHATGSRYICNPAPKDTDNDTVILVNGYYPWPDILRADGWEDCGIEYEGGSEFQAFRKGEENYIVTESPHFYLSYVKATEGAKALNLLNKEDRIKLFQAVNRTGMDGLMDEVQAFEMVGLLDPLVEINF